ncbi:hypothetical protein pipiens_008947 [Culex pipiens pipiens]|uniref:Uncharacterized protein n=1 Tax=Culex pipiens pipiens TaxID=38569 RepID=A0ABD1DFX4_CULPP
MDRCQICNQPAPVFVSSQEGHPNHHHLWCRQCTVVRAGCANMTAPVLEAMPRGMGLRAVSEDDGGRQSHLGVDGHDSAVGPADDGQRILDSEENRIRNKLPKRRLPCPETSQNGRFRSPPG